MVKGTLYGESVHFVIQNDSALYGRFAGQTLTMSGNAGLFFDPSLDEQVGYTNAESPLYDGSGNLVSAYATGFTLEGNSLDDGELDYFVIYGFHAQDWLSMAVYDEKKDWYIDQLLNLLKWYGHPSLQDVPLPQKSLEPEPPLPTVQAED